MYMYRAKIVRVVDGDTVDAVIDLGFGIMNGNEKSPVRFRLLGIDAPETRLGRGTTPEDKIRGLETKAWLADLIEGEWVTIKTSKDSKGKYGRWIATVFFNDVNLNEEMVDRGLAARADY